MKNEIFALGLGSLLLLASCGKEEPATPAEIESEASETAAEVTEEVTEEAAESDFGGVIDARQQGFKTLGGSFKTIRDNLQAGDSADVDAVKMAAAKMDELANDIATWFPAGSGPESGEETEALPAIWENPTQFTAAIALLKTATTAMDAAAQSGDMAAVGAAVRGMGGACKNCHDNFRLDD